MKFIGYIYVAAMVGLFVLIGVFSGGDDDRASKAQTVASAGTISDHSIGCLAKSDYDEFVTAARNKDHAQGQALLDSLRCFHIGGSRYSLVERSWFLVQIRVYGDSGSLKLWTSMESIPR